MNASLPLCMFVGYISMVMIIVPNSLEQDDGTITVNRPFQRFTERINYAYHYSLDVNSALTGLLAAQILSSLRMSCFVTVTWRYINVQNTEYNFAVRILWITFGSFGYTQVPHINIIREFPLEMTTLRTMNYSHILPHRTNFSLLSFFNWV